MLPLHRPERTSSARSAIRSRAISTPTASTHAYAKAAQMRRRRDRAAQPRRRPAASAPRRHLGRRHRARHRPRRARRQRRRPVGARGRAHGRARAAGARHGAPVPHHRGRCRRSPSSTATGRRWSHVHRLRGRDLHCARSAAACCSAPTSRPACPGRRAQTPWDFGHELLPPDLDRIAPVARGRLPSISRRSERPASSKVINGPFTFAPDGNPLVGPVRGLTQLLVRLRRDGRASARAAASASRSPNWMIEGDPGFDVWGMDVARYGDWATLRLHQRQGARELLAPLPHPLPQRGTAGRAAVAHDAALRPPDAERTP